MFDSLHSIAVKSIPNRINSSENIEQSLAVKMMKETMMRDQEMSDVLIESGKQAFIKGLNSTFEYKA
jgi:hypothetical protein